MPTPIKALNSLMTVVSPANALSMSARGARTTPKQKTSSEAPEGEMPLLCLEPCFLIIAGARLTAKSEHEATEKAAS